MSGCSISVVYLFWEQEGRVRFSAPRQSLQLLIFIKRIFQRHGHKRRVTRDLILAVETIFKQGVDLDSNFFVKKFGLATASRFRLLAKHRSGVRFSCCKAKKFALLPAQEKSRLTPSFFSCAGQESRTPHHSLENCYFTDKLVPQYCILNLPDRRQLLYTTAWRLNQLAIAKRNFFTSFLCMLFKCYLFLFIHISIIQILSK